MKIETERQEFEAWAVDEGFNIVEGRMGGYLMADTAAAWKAWQVQSAKASEAAQQAEAEPMAYLLEWTDNKGCYCKTLNWVDAAGGLDNRKVKATPLTPPAPAPVVPEETIEKAIYYGTHGNDALKEISHALLSMVDNRTRPSAAPQQNSSVPDGYTVEQGSDDYREILITAPDGMQDIVWPSDPTYELLLPYLAAAPQPEQKEEPQGTEKYRYCNHHHELTDDYCLVDFGDGEFVANREAVPLLRALNELGIRTRTHHVGDGHCFIGILMDNAQVEIREVHERSASRSRYNGKMELLVSWDRDLDPNPDQHATDKRTCSACEGIGCWNCGGSGYANE